MFQILLFFIFVHLVLLIPGYVAAVNSGFVKKYLGIELCFGYLISLAFLAGVATITYIFKISPIISQIIFWLIFFCSVSIFIYQKLYNKLLALWFPLASFFLMSVLSLAVISLSFHGPYSYLPDPEKRADRNYNVLSVKVLNVAKTSADDNYIPYRQAQFFINHSDPAKDSFIGEWGVQFFQRTPLMGAVAAQYFTALDDKLPIDYLWSNTSLDPYHTYAKFQIIAQVLNALFIIPTFYLIERFFNRRAAAMTLFFIIPSQFFLYNAFFSWPKSLVAFLILLSWLLILEGRFRYLILAGIASGMAYLTHDLAVLYIGASLLLLLYQKRIRDSFIFAVVISLFVLPWVFISSVLYKKPSSFYLYPISTKGIPQTADRSKLIRDFLHTSPLRLLHIRLESLFYLLSPYQLIYSEGGQSIARRFWALGLYSVPGSLGIGLIIPSLIGSIKKIKNIPFWILSLVPVILSTIVIGWPRGYGSLHFAEATVVLLAGLGCYWLITAKHRIWAMLAYLASTLQLLIFIGYSYPNHLSLWLRSPGDTVRLLCITAIIIICGLGVYFIQTDKPLAKSII